MAASAGRTAEVLMKPHPTRTGGRARCLRRNGLLLWSLVGCTSAPDTLATAETSSKRESPPATATDPAPLSSTAPPKPTPALAAPAAPVVAAPVEPTTTPTDESGRVLSTRSEFKPVDDAPRLVLVATRGGNDGSSITLLPATDGQLFAAAGPLLYALRPDGSIEHDPSWSRGIDVQGVALDMAENDMLGWSASALAGSWPEGAYLVLHLATGSRGGDAPPQLYRRNNSLWGRVDTHEKKLDWYPRRFGAWKDGSLLALKGFTTQYSNSGDGDVEPPPNEVSAFKSAVASRKKLVVLRGAPKAPAFGERDVQSFASLATGEIFAVLGQDGKAVVLHHDDASERTLPLPNGDKLEPMYLEIRATARDRAWVFGGYSEGHETHGYLARFDGTQWTQVETTCQSINSMSLDPAGAAYVVCPVGTGDDDITRVLLRFDGTTVEEIPTPSLPSEVVVRGPRDLWIVSQTDFEAALWHTGAPGGDPLVLPANYDTVRSVLQWADPLPLTDGCYQPWIPLVAGTDAAVADAKLDPLRAKEIYTEIVEARVQDRTELGVRLPGSGGKGVVRTVKQVTAALGSLAGTPSCNDRPSLTAKPDE